MDNQEKYIKLPMKWHVKIVYLGKLKILMLHTNPEKLFKGGCRHKDFSSTTALNEQPAI